MIPPADGVYFNAPGVASVRWDEAAKLVVAESNVRDSLDKVAPAALQVGYFATVEEAREWLAA